MVRRPENDGDESSPAHRAPKRLQDSGRNDEQNDAKEEAQKLRTGHFFDFRFANTALEGNTIFSSSTKRKKHDATPTQANNSSRLSG